MNRKGLHKLFLKHFKEMPLGAAFMIINDNNITIVGGSWQIH